MPETKKTSFYLIVIAIFFSYFHYYNKTVFQMTGLHIDSLWTVIKFVGFYGGPFAVAAFLFPSWNLARAFTASASIWLCVYLILFVFRNDDFQRQFPSGYHCLIVPITVYPLMGISLLLGHTVGRTAGAFRDPSNS